MFETFINILANNGLAIALVVILVPFLLKRLGKLMDDQQKNHDAELLRLREDQAVLVRIIEANTVAFTRLESAVKALEKAVTASN